MRLEQNTGNVCDGFSLSYKGTELAIATSPMIFATILAKVIGLLL